MSENKHTPEPWHLCEVENETGRIKHLVPVDAEKMSLLTIVENYQATFAAIYNDDDARRIVACVNACAGCATEVLETAPVGFFNSTYGHPKYLEEITKQRDELLAENEQLRKDAERYRVLRDSEYQLYEDDPSVSDLFFNQYFGEELDAAVDELKSRFDSTIASVKGGAA